MTTNRVPSLQEVMTNAVQSALAQTYHILPGIVVAYYPATQTADVQIAINDPRFDPDTDELTTEPWPIAPQMRVVWPRMGGFTLMGPLAAGNPVQVFFQDLDDSVFRATGQQGDPSRTRRHGSEGAFCVAWDMTDAGVATDAAAAGTNMIVGKDGGQNQIRITPSLIQLGASGGDFVALASKVDQCMSLIKNHTHVVNVTVTGVTSGVATAPGTGTASAAATLTGIVPTGSALVAAQ